MINTEKKNAMKEEAIARMNMLGLNGRCVQAFKAKKQSVWLNCGPFGGLYEADDQLKNMIKNVEKEHDIMVYSVIENMVYGMKVYSMLCITPDEEEWKMEQEDIKDGYVFCYALNVDQPEFSEFGTIAVKPTFGGLRRIG